MTDRQARRPLLVLTAALSCLCLAAAAAQTVLPDAAPAPGGKPEVEVQPEPVFPAAPPPGAPIGSKEPLAAEIRRTPASPVPVPTPAPREEAGSSPPAGADGLRPTTGMPAAETACRAALRRLGVEFEEGAPVNEPEGCAIAHPIRVTALSEEIALEPEAVLNCAMAEAAARFVADVAAPAAAASFREDLETVRHASSYVCRPRNGSRRLSEHAFGNALDLAGFELSDGRVVEVGSAADLPERTFLTRLRKAACGRFRTVLGPGSDADHADHFHFDLRARRSGSVWCE